MARNVPGTEGLAPVNALSAAWRNCLPSLTLLMAGSGRYSLRDLAVHYRSPGSWLVKVKALDTEGAVPVILFAAGDGYLSALLSADKLVKAGKWTTDRYPGKAWAR